MIQELELVISDFGQNTGLFSAEVSLEVAQYLFEELQSDDQFVVSGLAKKLADDFQQMLKKERAESQFKNSVESLVTRVSSEVLSCL